MANLTLNNKTLNDFNKLGIAFSGGLDSSVLLKLISEQDIQKDRITALHVIMASIMIQISGKNSVLKLQLNWVLILNPGNSKI